MLKDFDCLTVLFMWMVLVIIEIARTFILGWERGILDGIIMIAMFLFVMDRGLRD